MASHQRTANTPASGGRAGGWTPWRAADRGAPCYGWVCVLPLWGKGECGGSPNAEAGKTFHQRKIGPTPPPPAAFCPPPPKPAHGRRVLAGAVGTCLGTGTPFSSPASSDVSRPLHPPLDFWVAIEASRASREKAESKRAKQEGRTRLKSVLTGSPPAIGGRRPPTQVCWHAITTHESQ
jgi:hypothetical protein